MNSFDFLGCGLKFPFTLQSTSGGTAVSEEQEHIEESIRQILSTSPGERLMQPEFGSKLKSLIFEQDDEILADLLNYYITEAILTWEKRVTVIEVAVDSSSVGKDVNLVKVLISYQIITTQTEGNLTYTLRR